MDYTINFSTLLWFILSLTCLVCLYSTCLVYEQSQLIYSVRSLGKPIIFILLNLLECTQKKKKNYFWAMTTKGEEMGCIEKLSQTFFLGNQK